MLGDKALFTRLLKKHASKGRVGIFFRRDGVAVCHFHPGADVELTHCAFIEGASLDNPQPLQKQIDSWGLGGCHTSVVLSPKDYQLLLVEAPDVEESELGEALRWRVKDLVSYEIADAAIDYFSLPEDAYHGRNQMLYVTVAPKSLIDRVANCVHTAGLTLDVVDIPELALRNLAALQGDDTIGTAFLALQAPVSLVNLISDGDLYLTRQIETHGELLTDDPEQDIADRAEGMILEIQRSLDYYESQIGKPPCLKLVLCPLQSGETPLMTQFRYNLAVEILQLDIGEHLSSSVALTPLLQRQCLFAIAASLREHVEK